MRVDMTIVLMLLAFIITSFAFFLVLGVYLHITQSKSHPATLVLPEDQTIMDCNFIADKSDENIWQLLEGLASYEDYRGMEGHLEICVPCSGKYLLRVQLLRETGPARYNALYAEMLNVKKAKLLRKARNKGLEVNLAPIKNIFDLYRTALLINLEEDQQHLISEWDNSSEVEKSKLILNLTKKFNLF